MVINPAASYIYSLHRSCHLRHVEMAPVATRHATLVRGLAWLAVFGAPAHMMGDFGTLAEHFYTGEKQDEIHTAKKGAIEAALGSLVPAHGRYSPLCRCQACRLLHPLNRGSFGAAKSNRRQAP